MTNGSIYKLLLQVNVSENGIWHVSLEIAACAIWDKAAKIIQTLQSFSVSFITQLFCDKT